MRSAAADIGNALAGRGESDDDATVVESGDLFFATSPAGLGGDLADGSALAGCGPAAASESCAHAGAGGRLVVTQIFGPGLTCGRSANAVGGALGRQSAKTMGIAKSATRAIAVPTAGQLVANCSEEDVDDDRLRAVNERGMGFDLQARMAVPEPIPPAPHRRQERRLR